MTHGEAFNYRFGPWATGCVPTKNGVVNVPCKRDAVLMADMRAKGATVRQAAKRVGLSEEAVVYIADVLVADARGAA